MKTVEITFTRKVTYQVTTKVSDEDYEIIKDLDNDDVEMYDTETLRTLENGRRVISTDPRYVVLEDLDAEQNELEREETLYNVTVEEL